MLSLEVFADTGVTRPDGSRVAEESKSRISSDNPIADRALDFWKTLRTWVDGVLAGEFTLEKTLFRLYVTREFPGTIAHSFSAAANPRDAERVYLAARETLWDEEKDEPLLPIAAQLRAHLEVVFKTPKSTVCSIIRSFELEFGSGSTFDDLKARISEKFIADDQIETAMNQMLGWIKRSTDEAIAAGKPAIIAYDDFHTMVTSIVRKLNQIGILHSFASDPPKGDVQEHLQLKRYVQQLDLLELDEDFKTRAVIDYMKAEVDRVQWSKQLRVTERDLDNFESDLVHVWHSRRSICAIRNAGQAEIAQGLDLYSECSLHRGRVAGQEPPDHFCRGSFHALADRTKVPHIGWHPRYADLLLGDVVRDDVAE